MKDLLKKTKKKLHMLSNYIKLNRRIQITLYSFGIMVLLIIILLLVFAPLFSSRDFVSYRTKSCFRRHTQEITSSSEINYATVGNSLFMTYDFEQKCYRKLEVEHEFNNNVLEIFVRTLDLDDSCNCSSKVTARIGPIEHSELTVNVYKEADNDKYLVNTKTFEN